jgi:TRAP-type C4-dicarboxylate transport system substrate-binding protein
MEIEVYPGGQLFAAKDYAKAVPLGAVDMAQCWIAQWTGIAPTLAMLDLMLFYDGWHHLWRVLDSEAGEVMTKDLEKAGVKHLFWLQDGASGFTTKTPLKKLEDFKGKRIRSGTEFTSLYIKNLGAAPAFMGWGEVYLALQRNTVDGAISSVTSFRDRKYYEVTKHVTEPGMFYAPYACVMNLKKWKQLPADMQKILQAAGKDTLEWGRKEVQKETKESIDELAQKGMEIYYLPAGEKELWRKTGKPVQEVFVRKVGDQGKKLLEIGEKLR